MITKLSIANFKSIKQLDIDCRKINLFIGEPNTGKSNILEALALLSWCAQLRPAPLNAYVRFELMQYLFHDGLVADRSVEIKVSTTDVSPTGVRIVFAGGSYDFYGWESTSPFRRVTEQGECDGSSAFGPVREIRFYRFKRPERYNDVEPGGLKAPSGANLFSVVASSEVLQETMAAFFEKYGLVLVMEPHERVFRLQKQREGKARIIISYPYSLQSDTLQRIIFYTIAMASNRDSVLVFEEPESNAFPYYTRYLGKRIASDETNQFFIATHNPYLLSAIIEKGPQNDVQVFVTHIKNYQTRVRALTPDEVSELMEGDPFFDLDRFTEEDR